MKREDAKAFTDLLIGVADLYGKQLGQPAIALWWESLKDYDIEAVRAALMTAVKSPDAGQFMPKPADVIRAIEGTTVDRAMQAWTKALEAAKTVGAYKSVAFDDPAIHAAIEATGGWQKFCRVEADELPFLQKRFTDLYKANLGKSAPPYLPGEFEQHNSLRGYESGPLVYIGDRDKAMLSMNKNLQLADMTRRMLK